MQPTSEVRAAAAAAADASATADAAEVPIPEGTSKNTHAVVARLIAGHDGVERLLDIPCGRGAFTQRMLRKGYQVVSGDVRDLCEASGRSFAAANMNQPLPWPDDSFDAIACIDGIEHLERPFDFVVECHRVLRNGAVLVVSTPNISSLRSRWRWLLTGFHNKGKIPLDECHPNPMHHINLVSMHRLRYMLHRVGFEITELDTNRIKAMAWLYAPLVPISWLVTKMVFRREAREPGEQQICRQIARQMHSRPMLFGETIIAKAVCRK